MRGTFVLILAVLCCANAIAQGDLRALLDTEKSFEKCASDKGMKDAFLEYLADDSIIFHPNPVNGKDYWKRNDASQMTLVRQSVDADISSNGKMGYTTGNWRLFPKGKSEESAEYGQYVTVWERRPDGKFQATLDIRITHEKLPFAETNRTWPAAKSSDPNKNGWSPADTSMKFLRTSMGYEGLGGAYDKFAANEVRLLVEREPPVLGKKDVVSAMKRYVSIAFPRKIALLQAADMAYVWNPCRFANSDEGTEEGNCLQIWKLRDKKWWIVLGVFARVTSETKPVLKDRQKNKRAPAKVS
jgi:ketosteroid isomerase-like protein